MRASNAVRKPTLRVVRHYPRIVEDSIRPFRLFDCVAERDMPHRCYAYEEHALDQALLLAYKEEMTGRTLEVYDIRTGRWIRTYKRGADYVEFTK